MGWVLVLIICYAVNALGAANGAFRFAPFFFSYNQLAQIFFNNGNKWGEHADTKEDDKKKEAWWKTYTKMGFSGVGIWLPFILLSGATLVFLIPMFVASFWAFIAYIHIIVLLFLAYMCAGGMVLCIFMGVVENTKGEKDKPKNDEQEK